jgi:hypothetical protein
MKFVITSTAAWSHMNAQDRRLHYRGIDVTVHWVMRDSGPAGCHYSASYCLADEGAEPGPWRHFPQYTFPTSEAAVGFVAVQARWEIDAMPVPATI